MGTCVPNILLSQSPWIGLMIQDTINFKIPGIAAVFPEVSTNSKTQNSSYGYLSDLKKISQSGSAIQGHYE